MKNVLIIDSDPVFCHETSQMLEPMGIIVSTAETGAPGLAAARNGKPELIILSLEPGKAGYMLCRDLRKSNETNSSRIILTSDTATESDFKKHEKTQSRADIYLRKPVSAKDLLTNVSDLLGLASSPKVAGSSEMDPSLDFLDTSGDFSASRSSVGDVELDTLRSKLESVEQHNHFLKKEIEAFKEGTWELEEKIAQGKAKVAEQEKLAADIRNQLESKEEEVTEALARVDARDKELELLRGRIGELEVLEDSVQNLKVDIQHLEQEKSRNETALEEEKRDREMAGEEAIRLQHDLEAAQKHYEDQQSDLVKAREDIEDLERQIHELNARLTESDQVRGNKEKELESLQDDKLAVEMELDGLRAELETSKQKAAKTADEQRLALDQAESARDEFKRKLESAQKQAVDLITKQERTDLNVKRLESELSVAKASTAAVEKARGEESHKLNVARDEITRLKTEIEVSGSRLEVTEEKLAAADKMLHARLSELDKLKRDYKELESDRDSSLKEKDQLEAAFTKGIENLKSKHEEDLRAHKADWERIEAKLRKNLSQVETEKDALVKGLTMEKAELQEKLEGRIAELKSKLESSQQSFHEQKEMVFSLNKKLKTQEEEQLEELERLRQSHETELSRVRLEAEEEQSRIKAEQGKLLDELNKKVVALEQSNSGYEAQVSQLEKRLVDKESAHAAALEAQQKRITELEAEVESGNQEFAREKEKVKALESTEMDLRRKLEEQAAENAKTLEDMRRRHQEAMDAEHHKQASLTTERDGLRAENANLREVQEAYENLVGETERLRLGNETLRTRLEKSLQDAKNLIRNLQGEGAELELELEEN
ncbi:MAG: response regulator [Acidobacteriota bacterium]|nr:response regulator [Acidobacteriota bacterium]